MICRARCKNCGNQKETKGDFHLGKCEKCGKGPWDVEIGNGNTYPDGWMHAKRPFLYRFLSSMGVNL